MMTLAFRAQFGSEGGLRFVLPLLIGGAAAAPALYALGAPPRGRAALALALAVAAWAAPEAAGRAGRLARDGSMLAYLPSKSPETLGRFRAFDRSVLGGELRESVATAQRLVPPGETILVWHSAPFLLDFARNPIVDLNPSGLMGLRAKVPAYSYVLWQYRGYATRQPAYFDAEIKNSKGWGQTYEAARGRDCYRFLNDLAGRAEILSNDGQTVLLRLPPHLISSHPG